MASLSKSMVEVRNVVRTGAGQQYEWTYKMPERLAVRRDSRDFALAFDNVKETLEN